ncbi:MAG: hypothetical protein KGL39_44200 [Patescibacteria group bacterium]|nr:hypothetical protein [Patescibacteria group bacterium]
MSKRASKAKEPPTWDRRPWPLKGDTDLNVIYASIGRALSQWERYEGVLSLLFSELVAGQESEGARRAYSAVRTFEGRAEMLRAASEAWFADAPDAELLEAFKDVLRNALSFSQRRNDIAHGVVDYFQDPQRAFISFQEAATFALYPSYASFRERSLENRPTYCFTSVEIDYYFEQFYNLQNPVIDLTTLLINQRSRVTFQKRYYLHAPSSANLKAAQNSDISTSPPPPSSQE